MSNVFSRIAKAATPARIASGAAVLGPAIKPILGPGNIIGHVIEAIGKIAELADKAKQNKDDIKHFHAFAQGQLSAITKTIEDAALDRREVVQAQLSGALAVLSEVITTCDKLTTKNRAAATLDAASVSAELSGLQSRFQQAVSTFIMHAGIRTEAKVDSILDLELKNRLVMILRPLIQATHTWGDAPEGCLENTRKELLAAIDTWAAHPGGPHTFWLSGLGGTGKTAAARSAAKRLARKYRVASFFISRHHAEAHSLQRVLHTLVFQLVQLDHAARVIILGFLDANPDLKSVTLSDQVDGMLIKPLEAIPADKSNKLVILIDALDECSDVERLVGGAFLSSVINALPSMSGRVKLLLTSRREPAIQDALDFLWERLRSEVKLHEFMPERTSDDIRAYLEHSFNGIRDKHQLPAMWPSRTDADELVRRSGAFFIYAATLVRHIQQARLSPQKRLENILAKAGAEGPPGERSPYAEVDDLYLEVLCLFAGSEDEPGHTDLCDHVRQVVAAVVLGLRPMSVAMISSILGLELEDVRTVVRGLGALWIVPTTDDIPISLFHESFPDFIWRCADARFRLSPDIGHCQIARGCLGVMNDLLKKNICRIEYLPGKQLPSRDKIPDLNRRLDLHVPAHLKYSVEHWIDHFRSVQNIEGLSVLSHILAPFSKFCDEKLLYWIETLSLLDQNGVRRLIVKIAQPLQILQADALIASGRLLEEFLVAVQNFEEPLRRSHAEIYSFFLAFLPDGELSRKYSGHRRLIRLLTNPDSALSSSVHIGLEIGGVSEISINSTGSIAACILHISVETQALIWASTSIPTPTHRIPATNFALSPLGTTFALVQRLFHINEWVISVWSTNSTVPLARRAFNKKCSTLAFEPDGGRIVCVFHDAIQLIDVNDLRDVSGTRHRLEHQLWSASFVAGDSALAIHYGPGMTPTICTAAGGWKPSAVPGLPPLCDGAEIIAMSADQSVTLVKCRDSLYLVHSDPALGRLRISATAAELSLDGPFVAILSHDGEVTISRVVWHLQPQLADSRVLGQLDDGTETYRAAISFSPDGHHILLSRAGEVAVWDVNTGDRVFHQIREAPYQLLSLHFLGNQRLLHAIQYKPGAHMLQVMPISSPSPEAPPRDIQTQRIIAQSMCGIWVAIIRGGYGETLAEAPTFSIWNLMSGAGIKIDTSTFLDREEYGRRYPGISAASFTSNGSLVAFFKAGRAGLAIVFPSGIQSPDEVKTFRLTGSKMDGRNRRVKGCVVSPLGDRAAVYDEDGHVFIWDTPGFTSHIQLKRRLDMIAFSPDGLLLAGIFNTKTVCIFSIEDNSLIHEIVLQRDCHRLSISRGFISILSLNNNLSIIDYDGVELHATHLGDRVNLNELFFEAGGSQASHFTRRVIGVSPWRSWTVSGRTSMEATAWTASSAQAYRWPSRAEVSNDGWLLVSFDTRTTDWEARTWEPALVRTPLCWLPPSRRPPSKPFTGRRPIDRTFHVDSITWSGPRIIITGESGIITILDCSAHPLFQVPPATS